MPEATHHAPVTAVLPNYNHARYLDESISGILNQTTPPQAIIVIDDASSDQSLSIIRKWQKRSSIPFTVIAHEKNQGAVPSYIEGAKACQTPYIWFLAADDIFLPAFLERQFAIASQHPQAALVFSNVATFRDNPNHPVGLNTGWGDQARYFSPADTTQQLMSREINGHCLVRRDALLQSDCLEPRLRWHVDWMWNHVMMFRQGICYVPETLSMFRLSESSYSASRWQDKQALHDTYSCMLDLIAFGPLSDVAPYFVLSQVMDHFSIHLAEFVLATPKYHTPLCFSLIQPYLQERTNEFLRRKWDRINEENNPKSLLEQELPKTADWILESCRHAGIRRIAVYGAGKQTERLIQHWKDKDELEIVSILTTTEPKEDSFLNVPVAQASAANPTAFDAIVLSSMSYEKDMQQNSAKLFPGIPTIPMWSQPPDKQSPEIRRLQDRTPRLVGVLHSLGIKSVNAVGLPNLSSQFKQTWEENDGPAIDSHLPQPHPTEFKDQHCIIILDKDIPNPADSRHPTLRLDLNRTETPQP